MCGLAGILYRDADRTPSMEVLRGMAESLRHRGPDAEGFHQAPGIGLAFRRLSIIDLDTGNQPLISEDGQLALVCNGEIYNYRELTRELEARGHRFRTASDAEVILHLYREQGEDCVQALRGMFAFALWDSSRRQLLLARDRFGIKPLYYAETSQGMCFGSEQKALLTSDMVQAEPELQAIYDQLVFGYRHPGRTWFKGINELPPAHVMLVGDCDPRLFRYWSPQFTPDSHQNGDPNSPGEWAEALKSQLQESVDLHLRSDVPIACWLSPGIDSSSVARLASAKRDEPLHTFSLTFDDPRVNELARHPTLDQFPDQNLIGHTVPCGPDSEQTYPDTIWHNEGNGEPAMNIIGQHLAEHTAREFKVTLSGEGADEILGGYEWYRTDKLLHPISKLPGALRKLPSRFSFMRKRWPGACHILAGPADIQMNRYLSLVGYKPVVAFDPALFSTGFLDRLERTEPPPMELEEPPDFHRWPRFCQLQYLDMHIRLAYGIVRQLDRNSMAQSLEVRVPFLDHPLVELANRMPVEVKLKRLTEKHVLRRAMKDHLPAAVLRRRKYPLTPPQPRWPNEPKLPPFAADALSRSAIEDAGLFDGAAIARLRHARKAGDVSARFCIPHVVHAQIWGSLFLQSNQQLKQQAYGSTTDRT